MIKSKWTLELCREEALKYNKKFNFLKACPQAYKTAFKQKWLDDICSHMLEFRKPSGYWTKENCAIEAAKYKYKKDFQKNSKSVYIISSKNKWIDEICQHMIPLGSLEKRYIYKVIFPNNYIYIGLTWNPEQRFNSHLVNEKSSVYRHSKKTNTTPIFELVNTKPLSKEEAIKLEGATVNYYKKLGYSILNVQKTGGLGGGIIKWTFEKVKNEASKYKTKTEFILNNPNAYNASLKHKWIDSVCSHMTELKKLNNYWTKERCQEKALEYSSKKEFREKNTGAYSSAYKKGILNEICSHMIKVKEDRHYWNYENCKNEAIKYENKYKFKLNSSGAFHAAKRNNWLNDFFIKKVKIKTMKLNEKRYIKSKRYVEYYEEEFDRIFWLKAKPLKEELKEYFKNNLLDEKFKVNDFKSGHLYSNILYINPILPQIYNLYEGTNDEEIQNIGKKYNIVIKIEDLCYKNRPIQRL